MVALAKVLATGGKIANGIDIPGMGPCAVDMDTHTIRANKMLDINPQTIDDLAKII